MKNTMTLMTAQTPSDVRMPVVALPISGHAFGAAAVCVNGTVASAATSIVRDRKAVVSSIVAGATGTDLGLTQGYFPGTSAWRPPNC